jgi:MFS family permease
MTETKQNKFFYGWIIVVISTLALLISNGLSIGGIPVFYKFIQTDLVNSGVVAQDNIQSVYGLAPALTFLFAGLFAPVGGFLINKLTARVMMLIGCVILGAGLIVYSQATSPTFVYLAHSMLGISLGFVGVLVNTVLISNWFLKKRGSALGIVLTGTSFGGATIPLIATPLIQTYGWRTAMVLISLIIWVVLLPAVIFFVKNRPSDIGELPDGETVLLDISDEDKTPKENLYESGMTLGEALKTPIFWVFSVCAALLFYAIFVVSQQLNLYLQSPKIGFSPEQASFVQSMLFVFSIGGKFLFGLLADKFQPNRVMLLSASTMFLATLTFFFFNDTTVYLFAVFFGLNYGGTFVLLQLLVAEYFGLKEYGKILGVITVIETIGGAAGTIITGKIADANGGDFTLAFYGIVVVVGIALGLVLLLNLIYKKEGKVFAN